MGHGFFFQGFDFPGRGAAIIGFPDLRMNRHPDIVAEYLFAELHNLGMVGRPVDIVDIELGGGNIDPDLTGFRSNGCAVSEAGRQGRLFHGQDLHDFPPRLRIAFRRRVEAV